MARRRVRQVSSSTLRGRDHRRRTAPPSSLTQYFSFSSRLLRDTMDGCEPYDLLELLEQKSLLPDHQAAGLAAADRSNANAISCLVLAPTTSSSRPSARAGRSGRPRPDPRAVKPLPT